MSEYMEELTINEYLLEVECADQPRRFMKWGERYAYGLYDRDKAKQNLRVVSAETELQVRSTSPNEFGLDKFTEASIRAILDKHPVILKAENAYLEAVRDAELLRAARDAFDDRKKQLTNIVTLRNAQYFADPLREAEARETAARQAQSELLNKEIPA